MQGRMGNFKPCKISTISLCELVKDKKIIAEPLVECAIVVVPIVVLPLSMAVPEEPWSSGQSGCL